MLRQTDPVLNVLMIIRDETIPWMEANPHSVDLDQYESKKHLLLMR